MGMATLHLTKNVSQNSWVVALLVLVASVTAPALTSADLAQIDMASGLRIEQAQVYLPLPGQTTGVAYMTIHNDGERAAMMTQCESAQANRVELHNMEHRDGMMKMRRVDEVVIAAHSSVALKSGGTHLMLFGVEMGLQAGDMIDLQLHFSDGSQRAVQLRATNR